MSDPTGSERPDEGVPSIPPAPRYGEYAPGWGPNGPLDPADPAAAQAAAAPGPGQGAAPIPPGYAAPAAPAPGTPAYASPGYTYPPGYGVPPGVAAPGGRRRRTWDLVLTIILLALGGLGVLLALLYAWILSDPQLLDEAFAQQGMGGFDGEVGSAPTVLIVSHVLLYLIALGGSIALLVARRIAFWLPLVAGVIAFFVFWGVLLGVVMSDPSLMSLS